MDIAIVDTGYGNLRSVERATLAAAARVSASVKVVRTADPRVLERCDKLIFPGQGAFGDCARAAAGDITEVMRDRIARGVPFLGICVGLQLLFEGSDEAPGVPGLGILAGWVRRLDAAGVKIPHMGWNQLELERGDHPLLTAMSGSTPGGGAARGAWAYFVHSFHAVPADASVLAATVSYGENKVTAAVAKDNVFATQFHPEKSQGGGIALLSEFIRG